MQIQWLNAHYQITTSLKSQTYEQYNTPYAHPAIDGLSWNKPYSNMVLYRATDVQILSVKAISKAYYICMCIITDCHRLRDGTNFGDEKLLNLLSLQLLAV